ncbi:MAG: nitrile hydratase subunit beta [Gammaproteobacteria bacterium]
MNGVHDMGGMTCFGPVLTEDDEPVFHDAWEGRVFAMSIAAAGRFGSIDGRRYALEIIPAAQYLRSNYYERWLIRIEQLANVTENPTADEDRPILSPNEVERVAMQGRPANRKVGRLESRFSIGDSVRTRLLQPPGHTRLPRYARGRTGKIVRLHGTHVFPDTSAHRVGENPQPLYSVEFAATELWGPDVNANDKLYLDLWEDYLEAVRNL